MIKRCKIIWLLLLLLVMSCSGHKIVKEGGAEKGIVDKKETAFPTSSFILGSGDQITLNVWRHEDLKRTVQIDPSGNIYVPLVGEVEASGLTISQLREKIASGLSKYLVDPHVGKEKGSSLPLTLTEKGSKKGSSLPLTLTGN